MARIPLPLNLGTQEIEHLPQPFGIQGFDLQRLCSHCFVSHDNQRLLIPTEARGLVEDTRLHGCFTLAVKPDFSKILLQLPGVVIDEYLAEDCFVSWNNVPLEGGPGHGSPEILYLNRSSGRVVRRVQPVQAQTRFPSIEFGRSVPSVIFLPGLERILMFELFNHGEVWVVQCGPLLQDSDKPIIRPPNQAFVGKRMLFTPAFEAGANAKSVVYKLEQGVSGMQIDEKTGTITFEPTDANLGLYSVVVVANVDGVRVPVVSWELEVGE